MKTDLQNYRAKINELKVQHRAVKGRVASCMRELEEAETQRGHVAEAQRIIQEVAQAVQQQVHSRIATVVSRCLRSVFDEPYEFRIIFEMKRGNTEAILAFERDGLMVDPMSASGGGVIDVAAFALRISCLMLARPRRRRLLVLDEPFKFVSAEYRPRVRSMLEGLAEEMGVQIIMVTHVEELICGHVVQLETRK
jgi:DNA repair exonuclease SbcCD ATPase subunit